jgi:hypothetical protein
MPVSKNATCELSHIFYCETWKELHRAIQNKRHGMLTSGVVLLHDSARPHTAAHSQALLEHFNWELFDHPPCSPHLAPSDVPPAYLTEEVVGIIALQQWWVDRGCQNVAELTGDRLLCNRYTETYSLIWQVPQFQWLLLSEVALSTYIFYVYSNFFLIVCFVNNW